MAKLGMKHLKKSFYWVSGPNEKRLEKIYIVVVKVRFKVIFFQYFYEDQSKLISAFLLFEVKKKRNEF